MKVLRIVGIRLGLVLFGIVIALLLMEVILQIGAVYTRATGRPQPVTWLTNRRRVMCLGDSNTYGVKVPREQTYPYSLERIWNAAAPSQPAEILNFGFPGLNSSKMRKSFRGLMETFRPDVVLVMVGSNDMNSVRVPQDEEADAASLLAYFLWRHSRAFRFLYMLVASTRPQEPVVEIDYRREARRGVVRLGESEFDLAGTDRIDPGTLSDWSARLEENLRAMAADAEAIGARFVLLTYPSSQSLYGNANVVIQHSAGRSGGQLPLIDLSRSFLTVLNGRDCPELFLPDQHPTGAGYQLAAAIVWRGLQARGIAPAAEEGAAAFAVLQPDVTRCLERLDTRWSEIPTSSRGADRNGLMNDSRSD